jgi:hypothetical protein
MYKFLPMHVPQTTDINRKTDLLHQISTQKRVLPQIDKQNSIKCMPQLPNYSLQEGPNKPNHRNILTHNYTSLPRVGGAPTPSHPAKLGKTPRNR